MIDQAQQFISAPQDELNDGSLPPSGDTVSLNDDTVQPTEPVINEETVLDITDAMERSLDNLPIEMKEFAASHFTPELAIFLGHLLGEEVGDVVMRYADPEIVLLPFPRIEAEKMLGELPEDTQNAILNIDEASPTIN
jgi:hypothetical protein